MIELLEQPVQITRPHPFITKDGRKVFDKTIKKINSYFTHPATTKILEKFISLKPDQKDYTLLTQFPNEQPKFLKKTQTKIALPYSVLIVTENVEIYRELKKQQLLVQQIDSKSSLDFLQDYDIVHAIECDNTRYTLERAENVLFYDDITEVYAERHLKKITQYKESILGLNKDHFSTCQDEFTKLIELIALAENMQQQNITRINSDEICMHLNKEIEKRLATTSISATELLFQKENNKLPDAITQIVESVLETAELPAECFSQTIPLTINKDIFNIYQKKHETEQYLPLAQKVKSHIASILEIDTLLQRIYTYTLIQDFAQGIQSYVIEQDAKPITHNAFPIIEKATNPHIKKAQPIDYHLTPSQPATFLTGANSGGKTTLLEHIITLATLNHIGLPANGDVQLPIYDSIYYFAKNKGSTSKGAFETLLMQLATINTDGQTLILADEMESVTEPSVAAKVMAKTVSYFVDQGCHSIFATHLGGILQSQISPNVRIDGIEAKGFDKKNNIIIDHNPKINKLAASTPELIIQKLAKQNDDAFLHSLASVF